MTRGRTFSGLLIAGLSVAIVACIEPYSAPDVAETLSILVVDGFVDASQGSAMVRLSRTMKLNSEGGPPAEKGATVTVRSETGDSFTLSEQDSGRYLVDGMTIHPSLKYQLFIRTTNGEEYTSDLITITNTPPIDSITWRYHNDGIMVIANTHDVTGNSKYYRWDYVETWEYHSPFPPAFKVVNGSVVHRQGPDYIHVCYTTSLSTNILVGSSVRLDEDVIRDFPLVYIPRVSNRISVMYSIKVQQRVVDKAEYEFWQQLQQVTESLGGLFDSQPYEVVGNVHHVSNPSIPVLGFFSGGMVSEERIFIDYLKLPRELQVRPYHGCVLDTICSVRGPSSPPACSLDVLSLPANYYIIGELPPGSSVAGYTGASAECADCRVQGGTLTKPDFWP